MNNIEKLKILSRGKTSNWMQQAKYRKDNHAWLKYSSQIARRVIAAMMSKGMDAATMSHLVGINDEKMRQILKGNENLSLDMIAKISMALETELISFPLYEYSLRKVAEPKS